MAEGMPSLRKFAAVSLLAAGITMTGLGGVASASESAAPTNAVGQVHLDSGHQTAGISCLDGMHSACW
jgi:hypothetical protein